MEHPLLEKHLHTAHSCHGVQSPRLALRSLLASPLVSGCVDLLADSLVFLAVDIF